MKREFLKDLGLEDTAVDKIMAEHGKAVKFGEDKLEEYETLKNEKANLEKTIKALNDEKESLTTKYSELEQTNQSLTQENGKLKTKDLKTSIALKNNLPLDLADRLMGEDEESLQQDAERLAGFVSVKQTQPLKNYEPESEPKDDTRSALLQTLKDLKGE
ncbi:DUF4355 domain-containing protein [Facklamia sp. 7083-14-GEN3]|uniref:phage scaffolding protein n=1 Tax=Facklamia sp. 7083-14-GEN3 TaxID=2973478 RepID=UPI00215CC554|nr:DUF4355 domain-containing protein [Facklamia sp. 7083-14-GEN3]MCR8969280.1 phage scaffold protein [Facklamia sp. 7083-14-GEN3]